MRRRPVHPDFCEDCGDPLDVGEAGCCRACRQEVVELELDMAEWDEDRDGYWWDQQLTDEDLD